MTEQSQPVRLDKWLWAARFFKTRSLARQAITAGRVRSQGQRTKPSRPAQVGDVLTIRRGHDQLEVIVQALSAQRRGAPEADRKSTRLNSSHVAISYAVFCLKKKKKTKYNYDRLKDTQAPSK